jgi:hypothetical protein
MAHRDARQGKWRGIWRMEWLTSTLHTTSEHGVSSITTANAHTSAASSRLNWRPHRFKWNRPFRRKTKSGFCACAITFQLASINRHLLWCEAPYCAVSSCVHNVRQTWGHFISDFACKCFINICQIINHHTATSILMFQESLGYCVISVHMKHPCLLLQINLLNDLRGWFLQPPCITNRSVTIIVISCGCQNKS